MSYASYAAALVESGVITDPFLAGAPRFREEPVLLSAADARRLARAAEAIAEVYNEAALLVAEAPELLGGFLGLSAWQQAMWLSSAPLWHGIARADVFFTEDGGLQIAELNCDTPTGEAEAIVTGALARRARPTLVDPCARLAGLFAGAVEALAGGAAESAPRGGARRAAILYPTELPEDLPLVRLYKRTFEARGWEIVLGSPYNAVCERGRLYVFGAPVSLVLRHYKTDWWGERESAWADEALPDAAPLTGPLEAIMTALFEGTCAVVNPFGAVVPQNKRTMALMWEHIHRFSRRSQEAIRELVPMTRRLEALHHEQLLAQKDEWVVKSDYGAEGDEVVVGRLVTDEDWRATLALARPGRWIAQRYFQAKETPAKESVNHGVFLVAGRAAGLYARVEVGPTDEHALSAPVLVDPRDAASSPVAVSPSP